MKILFIFLLLCSVCVAETKPKIKLIIDVSRQPDLLLKKSLTVDWKTRVNPVIYVDGKLTQKQIDICEKLNARQKHIMTELDIEFIDRKYDEFGLIERRTFYPLPTDDYMKGDEWYEIFDYIIDCNQYDGKVIEWRKNKSLLLSQHSQLSWDHRMTFLNDKVDKINDKIITGAKAFIGKGQGISFPDGKFLSPEDLNYIPLPGPMIPNKPAVPKYKFDNFKEYTSIQKFEYAGQEE